MICMSTAIFSPISLTTIEPISPDYANRANGLKVLTAAREGARAKVLSGRQSLTVATGEFPSLACNTKRIQPSLPNPSL